MPLEEAQVELRHISPAPAEEVALDCKCESELGGSRKKEKQKTTELKGEGRFDPNRKVVS